MPNTFTFTSKIWLYTAAKAAWHFASVPKDITSEINQLFSELKRGWGSLKVKATIGNTSWNTSIFPDSKTKTYLLPLKAAVRKREKIAEGDLVKILLEISV